MNQIELRKDANSSTEEESSTAGSDRRDLLALLKLLKKYKLKHTEELFCHEANLRSEEVENVENVDDKELLSALTSSLASGIDANGNGSALGDDKKFGKHDRDPELYRNAYEDLRNFVDESLDIYKYELFMVLYPILVQIYFKLITDGHSSEAREFVETYGKELDYYYRDDLLKLLLITKPSEMENNDFVNAMAIDKFVIRMSRDAYSLFKRHIQERKQELISDIVNRCLHFDTYEGTARNKYQCDATSGSQIGEARRHDNKVRVYYGLLKEIDFHSLTTPAPPVVEEDDDNDTDNPDKPKKKKPKKDPIFTKKSKSDPNAPAIDRIPLPELKDADKLEKLKALREASKRLPLNKESLPSVCLYTILNSHNTVTCAEISDDSFTMAVGFTNSSIRVWSLTPYKLREIKSAELLRDIDKDSEDVMIRMMDDRTGESARTFYGHSGPVYRCAFSPEKTLLLSGSEDATIRLWSLHTWTCIVVYKGHLFPIWDVRFSPHGFYFVSCSFDKTARLWSTDSNQPLRVFVGHLSDVDCVQFHPNSNYIATGSSDRTVRLWDVLNGQLVRLMTGHKGGIYSLAFSTCGRYLASGSSDNNVLIWDLSHGQLVAKLVRHTAIIHTLCFSRDGTILAVGGMDCALSLWDFSKLTEDYLLHASTSSHNLEISEGDAYLIRIYGSKNTPFISLHFTRRNLLLAVGAYKSS